MSNTRCSVCAAELEIGDFPFCKGNPDDHIPVFGRHASQIRTVIFRAPDGTPYFPGVSDAPVPQGYEKVELKSAHEIRKFEKEVNDREYRKWEENRCNEELAFGGLKSENRSELRQRMNRMSPYGKDFARLAMKLSDERPRKSFEPGFYHERMSMDNSNTAPYRDARTGWRARRD